MSRPKGLNQKGKYRSHFLRISKYGEMVQSVYESLNQEIAQLVLRTDYDGSGPFLFSKYPKTKNSFDKVRTRFVSDLHAIVHRGTSEEWKQSNIVQDLLANKVLKFYRAEINDEKRKVYFQSNSGVLKSFQQRRDNGMTLSQKLWNQSANYKKQLEYAISCSIEKGISAVTLSKRLSKYLHDFHSLKKDYKEKFGQAVNCNDCEYRSIRLARTEINMAYRTAEQERWKQFDFVLGYEIKITQSGRHLRDICDDLKGRYPKSFVFRGWHPNCMCYVVPVLKSEEDFWGIPTDDPSKEILDVPESFKLWVTNNRDRIENASSLPYFLRDNKGWK